MDILRNIAGGAIILASIWGLVSFIITVVFMVHSQRHIESTLLGISTVCAIRLSVDVTVIVISVI